MKYIVGDIVSGYDSDRVYNFDILNPVIMLGGDYPLNETDSDVMICHYIDKTNCTSNVVGKIVGHILQENSNYPLLYIDKDIFDSFRRSHRGHGHISICSNRDKSKRPFLSCIRTEKTFFVELTLLEEDNQFIMSLIDLYVLYLSDISGSILPIETVELMISQLTNEQKNLGLSKYYKEFC